MLMNWVKFFLVNSTQCFMSDLIIFSDVNLQACVENWNLKNDTGAKLYYIQSLNTPPV